MRIDSAQLTNASISGSFSGSITSTAEQPIVSGSSQVVLTATTGFGTYSASVATYTDAKVADLVDSSPGALDTLNELAAALGDDSNFSASLATSVGNRLPTATFNTYSGSSAGAIRGEYVAAVNTLSGSAHIRRNQISASLDATIDALDSLGISTDTERGALSGSAHTDRIAKVSVLSGSAHTDRIAKVGILSGSAHAQRVIEKNIAAGLVSSLSGGQVATNATTAGAALPKVGGAMTGAITTNSTFDGRDVATDGTKLDGIEASATADQTNDEIKAAVEAASDSNTFTDDDHTKLNAIEASATADQTASELRSAIGTGNGNLVPSAGSAGTFLKHDGSFGTPSYTTNTNTTTTSDVTTAGALMDSEVDNLAEVKAFDSTDYATAAQGTKADAALPKGGGAMTGAITTNSTFDGRDVATDGTKLDGIESSATADQTLGDLNLDTDDDVRFDSFGVGTAASGTTGEIRATGDITAYYSSDERLKENFAPLAGALDKVNQIGGYEFDWKEGIEEIVSKEGHDIGVKAQEVQAVYPELVHERDNGYLAVDYVKLTAVLIEAVKELSAKVDKCNCN